MTKKKRLSILKYLIQYGGSCMGRSEITCSDCPVHRGSAYYCTQEDAFAAAKKMLETLLLDQSIDKLLRKKT